MVVSTRNTYMERQAGTTVSILVKAADRAQLQRFNHPFRVRHDPDANTGCRRFPIRRVPYSTLKNSFLHCHIAVLTSSEE